MRRYVINRTVLNTHVSVAVKVVVLVCVVVVVDVTVVDGAIQRYFSIHQISMVLKSPAISSNTNGRGVRRLDAAAPGLKTAVAASHHRSGLADPGCRDGDRAANICLRVSIHGSVVDRLTVAVYRVVSGTNN